MPEPGVLASDSSSYRLQQAGLRRNLTDLLSVLTDSVGRPRSSILFYKDTRIGIKIQAKR